MLINDPRTAVLFGLLVSAAVIDYHTYKIPNWLTVSGAVFGLAYSIAVPFSPQAGWLWSLGGLALGLALMLPLYMLKAMGAGDVKLMAMIGTFLGVSDTFYAVLATFIVGGIAALGYVLFHRVADRMLTNIKHRALFTMLPAGGTKPHTFPDPTQSVGKLPYGVSISIGTIGYVLLKQVGYL